METLSRRQWNLKSTEDQFQKFQSNFLFPPFYFISQVSYIKTPKQVDEFIEIQSSTGTWYQRWLVRITTTFKQVKRRKNIPQGLLSFRLQCLITSGRCVLKPGLSLKKNLLVFAKGCNLITLCRQMCASANCHTASQAPKYPCEHHSSPAVQSFQDRLISSPKHSPSEQINIDSLCPKPK